MAEDPAKWDDGVGERPAARACCGGESPERSRARDRESGALLKAARADAGGGRRVLAPAIDGDSGNPGLRGERPSVPQKRAIQAATASLGQGGEIPKVGLRRAEAEKQPTFEGHGAGPLAREGQPAPSHDCSSLILDVKEAMPVAQPFCEAARAGRTLPDPEAAWRASRSGGSKDEARRHGRFTAAGRGRIEEQQGSPLAEAAQCPVEPPRVRPHARGSSRRRAGLRGIASVPLGAALACR